MNFSKSRYVEFCQCPKLAWLAKYKPEERVIAESVQAQFDEGNVVGDLAMGLFGDFVEATAFASDGKIDLSTMVESTKRFLSEGRSVITEASFNFDGLYCAVDILKKDGDGYAIYEVKSTTSPNKNVYHIDIAYQKYVLEHCGIAVTKTYLVTVNGSYVRNGDIDLSGLFVITDCSAKMNEAIRDVATNLAVAETVVGNPTEPNVNLSMACFEPYTCPFFGYCGKDLPKPSVFDLYRLSTTKKVNYYNEDAVEYKDLCNKSDVCNNVIRKLQIQTELNGGTPHIDKIGIRGFLSELTYPLYFLDFETQQSIIPPFDKAKPFQQIPFQYSLHYIESNGGELNHKEFLGVSGEDSRRIIAENLVRDIPDNACVLAYNKSFECGRIKELAEMFPDLAEPLMKIQGNIVDLLSVFSSGYYYLQQMHGSLSIKSVLPAMFPNDPSLNYDNLDGVHNGGQAMTVFKMIKDMPIAEQASTRQNLLKYCELDTLAMVRIWQELTRVSK